MRSKKILIIENDHDARVEFRMTLEEQGYTVCSAANGKTALEALNKNPSAFKLIFLDINMPIMDGNEFLRVKSYDPDLMEIPVIAVISEGDDIRFPVVGLLRKPVAQTELLKAAKSCPHHITTLHLPYGMLTSGTKSSLDSVIQRSRCSDQKLKEKKKAISREKSRLN